MIMRPGDRIQVEAAGLDERGAGLVDQGAHRLHVAGLLPGEQAEVIVEHVSVHQAAGLPVPDRPSSGR